MRKSRGQHSGMVEKAHIQGLKHRQDQGLSEKQHRGPKQGERQGLRKRLRAASPSAGPSEDQ